MITVFDRKIANPQCTYRKPHVLPGTFYPMCYRLDNTCIGPGPKNNKKILNVQFNRGGSVSELGLLFGQIRYVQKGR